LGDWLVRAITLSCRTEKYNIDIYPISTDERQRPIFAVFGSNGTEFSYELFW